MDDIFEREEEEMIAFSTARAVALDDHSGLVAMSTDLVGAFKCGCCSFICAALDELMRHYEGHRSKEPLRCFQCGFEAANESELVEHTHNHLEKTYYTCTACLTCYTTTAAMERHLTQCSQLNKTTKFPCPICKLDFVSNQNLSRHYRRCKEEAGIGDTEMNIKEEVPDEKTFFTCVHCFFIFSSEAKRARHVEKVHSGLRPPVKQETSAVRESIENEGGVDAEEPVEIVEPPPQRIYLCPICHFVFTSVTTLKEHVVTHNVTTQCPVCDRVCATNFELKQHLQQEHAPDEAKHGCSICDLRFPSLNNLKNHVAEEHSSTKFSCPFCSESMGSEEALQSHIENHSKVRDYRCPECPKFSTRNFAILQNHMSYHHPSTKRFPCRFCPKSYKLKYSLQRHLENCAGKELQLSVVGEEEDVDDPDEGEQKQSSKQILPQLKRPLRCVECRRSFSEVAHLKRHLQVHLQSAPFRCMRCGLRCKSKHILSQHMKKAHQDDLNAEFECSKCHKRFKHRHALNNHALIHSDVRPYVCHVCGTRFKRKANYRRHYDTHSDVRPFSCEFCSYTTRRKDGLQKHMETHGAVATGEVQGRCKEEPREA